MTQAEMMEFATTVFVSMHVEPQDRLMTGLVRRQAMHDAIKRGASPRGYRPEWVRTQSQALAKYMGQVAEDFNREHADDRASHLDILDILSTVASVFRSRDDEEE